MSSTGSFRAPSMWRASVGAGIAAALAAAFGGSAAEAKTPGHQYCFYGTCHRVQSIAETEKLVGSEIAMQASFYDDCKRDTYNPCGLTSSGEAFRPDQPDNAASPVFPDGTTLLLFNPRSKGAAVVRVNNAGPYWGKRKLDVSRAAAEKLGFRKSGVADLKVRVLKAPTNAEATYKKNRKYTRVPGYIGQYADAGAAHRSFAAVAAIEAMAGSLLAPIAAPFLAAARGEYVGSVVQPSGVIASAKDRTTKKGKAELAAARIQAEKLGRSKVAAISPAAEKARRRAVILDAVRELTPQRGLPGQNARVAKVMPVGIWF